MMLKSLSDLAMSRVDKFLGVETPTKSGNDCEETLKRLQSSPGVIGTIVINSEGIPIKTTMDNSTTVQYAGLLHQLKHKASSCIRDIDPTNEMTFLRIRTKKHEVMIAPDRDYMLIVIQSSNPQN